jgi:glucokinase
MTTVLAGDVGGTNARIAYFEGGAGKVSLAQEWVFKSRSYPSLESILGELRARDARPIAAAAFGVAGPVMDGHSETLNLAWTLEATRLATALGLPRVRLINDLEANAFGLGYLGPEDLVTLQKGHPEARGHRAVISAGTGLGQAGLYWDGAAHRPFASEGGHVDFAPRDAREAELWSFLFARGGHVSYERVLSGPGLLNLYAFLKSKRPDAEPAWLAEELGAGDPSAAIARNALSERSELCAEALDWFVSIYGAAAGNVALQFFSTGGIYVGGGIAPKILPRLSKDGRFRRAFLDKGRMRPLLESIPVHVITQDKAALWGAAHAAFEEAAR